MGIGRQLLTEANRGDKVGFYLLNFVTMRISLSIACLCCAFSMRAQFSTGVIAEQEMKAYQRSAVAPATTGAVNNSNVIYDRINWYINPAVRYITGEVTTIFIAASDISFIEFDLTDSLGVDSVIYHNRQLPFTRGNNVLHINLPAALPNGTMDSISIFYEGVPSSSGFGSFEQSTHDSVPIIWTLSEPYGARDWWPCKQNLQDKIDSMDVFITCPSAFNAASNGLLVGKIPSGENTTYHWRHRYPIATYLVCLAVTNYRVFVNLVPFGGDTVSIFNYVYPESYDIDTSEAGFMINVMQLYDSLFGLYPFSKEKYGQVQFGWKGGMEHQTMTFMYEYNFELAAHELAHHWFGDKVTCDSWHDIWLNEGFAVYLSGLCYEHLGPVWFPIFKRVNILAAIDSAHGSVWCDDTTSVSRIFNTNLTYSKGEVVLSQLAWMMGEHVLFEGLRNYLTDTSNAYQFGTTLSLQKHIEQVSGLDLTDYFNQYVYGRGFPSYQVQWSQDASRQVTLTIGQTQSDPSVQFFKIPIPIEFQGVTGDSLMVFNPSSSGQSYSFELPFLADTLLFDPNWEILSGNNTITRTDVSGFTCLVYPNPTSGTVHVQLNSGQSGNADAKIYSTAGQLMWAGTITMQSGASFYDINISRFATGKYELKITNGKQSATVAFVVTQ